jgi:AcrR family transcriptional regulator
MSPAATRVSADVRRESVLAAAVTEFARTGLAGTSTQAIAERAGISQPYLFRLFPTKKALFLAAADRVHDQIIDEFEQAAGEATGEAALALMGARYADLIRDRSFLLMQLQTYAAADNAEIRDTARAGFRRIWQALARITGADADAIRAFYAMGMLCNVITALDIDELDEPWAHAANPEDPTAGT